MAKQAGHIQFTGTVGQLTYYQSGGIYYVRSKSSINARRIKRDPAFTRFRDNSKLHGQASKIASQLYRTLDKKDKKHGRFGKLTAEVKKWLQEGLSQQQIITAWHNKQALKTKPVDKPIIQPTPIPATTPSFPDHVIQHAMATTDNDDINTHLLPDLFTLNFQPKTTGETTAVLSYALPICCS